MSFVLCKINDVIFCGCVYSHYYQYIILLFELKLSLLLLLIVYFYSIVGCISILSI
jgi:hypothetical protein